MRAEWRVPPYIITCHGPTCHCLKTRVMNGCSLTREEDEAPALLTRNHRGRSLYRSTVDTWAWGCCIRTPRSQSRPSRIPSGIAGSSISPGQGRSHLKELRGRSLIAALTIHQGFEPLAATFLQTGLRWLTAAVRRKLGQYPPRVHPRGQVHPSSLTLFDIGVSKHANGEERLKLTAEALAQQASAVVLLEAEGAVVDGQGAVLQRRAQQGAHSLVRRLCRTTRPTEGENFARGSSLEVDTGVGKHVRKGSRAPCAVTKGTKAIPA